MRPVQSSKDCPLPKKLQFDVVPTVEAAIVEAGKNIDKYVQTYMHAKMILKLAA